MSSTQRDAEQEWRPSDRSQQAVAGSQLREATRLSPAPSCGLQAHPGAIQGRGEREGPQGARRAGSGARRQLTTQHKAERSQVWSNEKNWILAKKRGGGTGMSNIIIPKAERKFQLFTEEGEARECAEELDVETSEGWRVVFYDGVPHTPAEAQRWH